MNNKRFGPHELYILQILRCVAGVRRTNSIGVGSRVEGVWGEEVGLSLFFIACLAGEKEAFRRGKTQLKNTWNTAPYPQILLISQPIIKGSINHAYLGLPKVEQTGSTCFGDISGALISAWLRCPNGAGRWNCVSSVTVLAQHLPLLCPGTVLSSLVASFLHS